MPQLMPLLWVFSFFMILYLVIVSVILYDYIYGQYLWLVKEEINVMNKNWKW